MLKTVIAFGVLVNFHHNIDTFYYHSENYTWITLDLESASISDSE